MHLDKIGRSLRQRRPGQVRRLKSKSTPARAGGRLMDRDVDGSRNSSPNCGASTEKWPGDGDVAGSSAPNLQKTVHLLIPIAGFFPPLRFRPSIRIGAPCPDQRSLKWPSLTVPPNFCGAHDARGLTRSRRAGALWSPDRHIQTGRARAERYGRLLPSQR